MPLPAPGLSESHHARRRCASAGQRSKPALGFVALAGRSGDAQRPGARKQCPLSGPEPFSRFRTWSQLGDADKYMNITTETALCALRQGARRLGQYVHAGLLAAVSIIALAGTCAHAAPYVIDPLFNGGAIKIDRFAGTSNANYHGRTSVRMANGDTVVVGSVPAYGQLEGVSTNIGLVRYTPQGARVPWPTAGSFGFYNNRRRARLGRVPRKKRRCSEPRPNVSRDGRARSQEWVECRGSDDSRLLPARLVRCPHRTLK